MVKLKLALTNYGGKMKKIVALGDSLTYGYMISPGSKWVDIINRSQNEFNILNRGINGDTVRNMSRRLASDVVAYKPDSALIWGGANDFYFNEYPIEETFGYFEEIDAELKNADIEPYYVIGSYACVNAAFTDIERSVLIAMNDKFDRLREFFNNRDFCFLDMWNLFKSQDGIDEIEFFNDGIHFNDQGSKLVAEKIRSFLQTIL